MAETGFRLAIVFSSIAIAARARALLWAGAVIGVASLVTLLNGFFQWASGFFRSVLALQALALQWYG